MGVVIKLFFLSIIKFVINFKINFTGVAMEEIKKLKIILKKYDISLEKAAREMGISFQTIWKWMNGKHGPSELALIQLRKFIKKYENHVPLTG